MQVVYRSVEMMRDDVPRDRRGHQIVDRLPRREPRADRVDDTSRVRASTRKIDVAGGCRTFRPAGASAARSSGVRATAASSVVPGRAITTKCAASSTAGNSRHVAISANASAPRMKKSCDGCQPCGVQRAQRVDGVGRSRRGSAPCPTRGRPRPSESPAPPARSGGTALAQRIGRPVRRIVRRDRTAPRRAPARARAASAASRWPK